MRKIFEPRNSKDFLSILKGVLILILSSLFTLVFGISTLYYLHHYQLKKEKNKDYTLKYIIQSNHVKEALKTEYLAELMELSIDRPINIFNLNLELLAEKILKSPVIKQCQVKLAPPNSVLIEYKIRIPMIYLSDFDNSAIDSDKVIIPIAPFYTPKNLPEVYLGIKPAPLEVIYGKKIKDKRLDLAIKLLEEINQDNLKKIDLSLAYSSSYGSRQVILVLRDEYPIYLRLSTINYKEGWQRYLLMKKIKLFDFSAVVDLRVSQIALIKKIKETHLQSH
jgi:cell division septal protein FtsQ